MDAQILVAGAGPVGLTMAASLARLGVAVRIVDPAPARSDTSKALVIWPRTLELLDIQGCVQEFLEAGMAGTGLRIMAHRSELARLAFATAQSRFDFALLLPQNETERLLEAELARHGVAIERRVSLRAFTDDAAGVDAVLADENGNEERARFDYLVGCDGAHSTVRHTLGVPFAGSTEPSEWVLADLHLDGALPDSELLICWEEAGLLAMFPIIGGRWRVVADIGETKIGETPTLADIQSLLDTRGPAALTARDPVWLSRFRINERKVAEYSRRRVFLAGDAAHVHSPAGGQGMNTGMQDAFNLAWKLAFVCKGSARPTLLDSYSPERSAIGDQVLRNASQLTHVAVTRNPVLQGIRNAVASVASRIPTLRQRLVDQLAELDLHYAEGGLTAPASLLAPHPANGYRAPDIHLPWPRDGFSRLHEILRAGRFAVISANTARIDLPPDLARIASAEQVEIDNLYTTDHHYLIRPDGYVALTSPAVRPEAILDHLRLVLGV